MSENFSLFEYCFFLSSFFQIYKEQYSKYSDYIIDLFSGKCYNTITGGDREKVHLFSSRTQKLSFSSSKILGWRRPGKIEHCRLMLKLTSCGEFFLFDYVFYFAALWLRKLCFHPGRLPEKSLSGRVSVCDRSDALYQSSLPVKVFNLQYFTKIFLLTISRKCAKLISRGM